MTTKKENATGQISIRLPPQELEEARRFAGVHGFGDRKFSDWVRQVIYEAVHRDEADRKETDSPATRPLTLSQQLANEEVADLIYQLVADKLRLADLRAELAAFSRRAPAASLPDLDADLRMTAARIASVPQAAAHEDEWLTYGEVEVVLKWDKKWTLDEYLALPEEKRRESSMFYQMVVVYNGRDVPYYFWHLDRDFHTNCLDELIKNGFDTETYTAYVYGAKISVADWCRRKYTSQSLAVRVVQMMRYVARDNNIGEYTDLFDKELRYFTVKNTGNIPSGLPCRFIFGWVSDARNADVEKYETSKEAAEAARNRTDETFRPVATCRWHYTDEECRELGIGTKLPFDEEAVPRQMRKYLAY